MSQSRTARSSAESESKSIQFPYSVRRRSTTGYSESTEMNTGWNLCVHSFLGRRRWCWTVRRSIMRRSKLSFYSAFSISILNSCIMSTATVLGSLKTNRISSVGLIICRLLSCLRIGLLIPISMLQLWCLLKKNRQIRSQNLGILWDQLVKTLNKNQLLITSLEISTWISNLRKNYQKKSLRLLQKLIQ